MCHLCGMCGVAYLICVACVSHVQCVAHLICVYSMARVVPIYGMHDGPCLLISALGCAPALDLPWPPLRRAAVADGLHLFLVTVNWLDHPPPGGNALQIRSQSGPLG